MTDQTCLRGPLPLNTRLRCLIVSLDLGRKSRSAVHTLRAGLAVVNCPGTFHSIELRALPRLLAVLFSKPLAVHFVATWATVTCWSLPVTVRPNEVVVNVRIVANRAGAQGDGEQRACNSDLYVCASGLRSL